MNEKRQTAVANTKMNQVLELREKNFRVATMKMLQQSNANWSYVKRILELPS